MFLLLLMLLQDAGYEALMLRMPNSAVGDCMVFVFEKDDDVQVGFYIMDSKPETNTAILHLSTFLEQYRDLSEERLRKDSERLSLDLATIEKLRLAIKRQVSLIDRSATQLSSEIAKVGLTNQLAVTEQSNHVETAGAILIRTTRHVNSANTLYTKILSRVRDAESVQPNQLAPEFYKGGFASSKLSDPTWSRKSQNVPNEALP